MFIYESIMNKFHESSHFVKLSIKWRRNSLFPQTQWFVVGPYYSQFLSFSSATMTSHVCNAAEHTYNMFGRNRIKSASVAWLWLFLAFVYTGQTLIPWCPSSHSETAHSHQEQPVFVCVSWHLLRNSNSQKGKVVSVLTSFFSVALLLMKF